MDITAPSSAFVSAGNRLLRAFVPTGSGKLKSGFAAPRIHASPVREEELDGHVIFRPAGDTRTIGHLLHFHGLGGLSKPEIEFMHRLAAGKFQGEPVVVVAPLAQRLAPKDVALVKLRSIYALARFVRQQPPDVQTLLLRNFVNDENFVAKAWKLMQAVGNPPWWYPFVFTPEPGRDELSQASTAVPETKPSSMGSRTLRPDLDATIKLMFRTAEEIAPRTDGVLDRLGVLPGHICASGFSQGVGLALIFGAILRPRKFCRLVIMCASHVKTASTPAVKDTDLKVDVILPRGDRVLATTGFRDARTRGDLEADFHGRVRIREPPGRHAVEGHVAHIAGIQIVNSLRRSHKAGQ